LLGCPTITLDAPDGAELTTIRTQIKNAANDFLATLTLMPDCEVAAIPKPTNPENARREPQQQRARRKDGE